MKILIIDDDAELVRLAQFSLGRVGGFEVVTATDGASGLREAETHTPDAILLDMTMPQMDGTAVLEALRANAKTRDIPVAFLSAKKTASDSASALRNRGVIGAIAKPFDVNLLPAEVSALLTEYERVTADEISVAFLRSASVQLRNAEDAVRMLASNAADPDAIATLRHIFHKLAGSAGTFGYPSVSAVAAEAEEECDRAAADSGATPILLRNWECAIEHARTQFFGAERGTERRPATRTPSVFVSAPPNPQLDEATELLRAGGYLVQVFEKAQDAVNAFHVAVPDVLITSRSYDLIDQLRFARHGSRTAVVIIGGERVRFPESLPAVQRDVDAVLQLPLDAASIVGTVRMLAERKETATPHVLSLGFPPDLEEMVSSIVESAGYRLRASAAKNLDSDIDALDPDLILLGPDCGAFSACDITAHVRLARPRGTFPVVMIGNADALQSARCGADASLDLPLSPPLLLTTMAACIERSRAIRFLMLRDPITGALTERAFAAKASRALREGRTSFVLAAISIPASVVDGAADLVALAALMRSRLRETDVIGVSRPNELLVLLEGSDESNAASLLGRLAVEFAEQRVIRVEIGAAARGAAGTFYGWRDRARSASVAY